MRDGLPVREAVEQARRKQEDIADDRARREGRLGDEELNSFLLGAYPSLVGQLN